ncbi:hypothetical protein [Streptomyces sp. NPDC048643]|uniref:hypothetical protein n=1 Tax=Streptomyces sp. NPDC048643 TaxID=3155637 RepID=UPI003429965F
MTGLDPRGRPVTVAFDPAVHICTELAAELADEWVELAAAAGLRESSCLTYRRAINSFCTHVDATVGAPQHASLAREIPELHLAVTEWIRLLPASFPAGSRRPYALAGRLRMLIARRIAHPGRPVAGHFDGWVAGAVGMRRGRAQEVDEFSRADKKKLIQAAWTDRLATEARIRAGWTRAAAGSDPADDGWTEPNNLLWALANGAWTCEDLTRLLPPLPQWPPALRELAPDDVLPHLARGYLLRHLVRMLFPTDMDLHSYRILLMAATGRASEEVVALDEDDLEYGDRSVLIDFTKHRARSRQRRSYSAPDEDHRDLHPSAPRLDAVELTLQMLQMARPLAERAGMAPVPLFLRASVDHNALTIRRFVGKGSRAALADWLKAKEVTVQGPADIRRLRKSGKVEKAIAFKGRISDIADDHTEETFRTHYAHGTTLRVISGHVITSAQRHWLDKALNGPLILSEDAEKELAEPGAAEALGLSAADVEQLRSGEMDMGVSSCRDPFASPFGRPGQLCPVAPTRCLECRNAFVLPSNLPQLLLFAAHLEQLQHRLAPGHFHALWGQSRANVLEALSLRTSDEITQAHERIAAEGLTLNLPLSTRVEFE